MLLDIKDFQCTPNIISPSGQAVSLGFKAISGEPTHLRARFWISNEAPFVFKTGGTRSKQVFFPGANGKVEAPIVWTGVGPKDTSIVPQGETKAHDAPLKVNLEVIGFDDDKKIGTVERDVLVTIDMLRENTLGSQDSALSMALRLVNSDVGVSQRRIAEILSSGVGQTVSEGLVNKVIQGGSSAALLEKLRGG